MQTTYLDVQDFLLREFDANMTKICHNLSVYLEDQILKADPFFGEETGDFIDFARTNP